VAADRPSFSSRVDHNLDDKGRLVVPARFRDLLGSNFFLSIGLPDPCLALYPEVTWEVQRKSVEGAVVNDLRLRDPARYLFAHTDRVACDSQGRLFLPVALRAYAHIDKDVVSIGNNARVEIWSRDLFEQRTAAFEAKLAAYSSADDEGRRNFPEIPGLL
jgi:MraZ protein